MTQRRVGHRIYGLCDRFRISLLMSFAISVMIFLILFGIMDDLLLKYNRPSDEEIQMASYFQSLQDFVEENKVSSGNLLMIREWEATRPIILLEIYREGDCIYSSIEDNPKFSIQNHNNQKDINAAVIHLSDIDVEADLYIDFKYQYYLAGIALAITIAVIVLFLLFIMSTHKLVRYIRRLSEEIHILEGGNLDYEITVRGNDEVTDLAISMNNMRESFKAQMETEQRLHKISHQMTAEISHDLRTPLTGIMLYVDILRLGNYSTNEELNSYLEKINAKACQMKELLDHLLEYNLEGISKKRTGTKTMEQAFSVVADNFKEELKIQGFEVVLAEEWPSCFVCIDDEYSKRIFDNIVSNISRYADPKEKVYFKINSFDDYCGFTVVNTRLKVINNESGSGLGIESIRSMMKDMGGTCTIAQSESSFEISLLFPKS